MVPFAIVFVKHARVIVSTVVIFTLVTHNGVQFVGMLIWHTCAVLSMCGCLGENTYLAPGAS